MWKKIRKNRDQDKPRLTAEQIEKKLRKHFKVVPVGTPSEAQLRFVSLHLWMTDQARNPDRVSIFAALEHTAIELGYDPSLYKRKAQDLFDLLDQENQ